jgi:membrane-bound ClpP family serine protease
VLARPVNVRGLRSDSVVVDSAPRSTQTWQKRFRDPALTVLLILDLCTIFLAVPLAAKGLPTAKVVADALVLVVVAIVVMLSLRWNAIILILLGLAAIVASFVISGEASPISVIMLAAAVRS